MMINAIPANGMQDFASTPRVFHLKACPKDYTDDN